MRAHSMHIRVAAEQVDGGDHLNWLAQLQLVQEAHFALRDELGLGLDALKEQHGLFLVMGRIHEVTYRRQLRLHDAVEVRVRLWPSRATCFELDAELVSGGRIAATMRWMMPLISMATGRPCRIPAWMLEAVGAGAPDARAPGAVERALGLVA
jgi:acyl-CoA thioesterase FadM